jgi:hypothetical protein
VLTFSWCFRLLIKSFQQTNITSTDGESQFCLVVHLFLLPLPLAVHWNSNHCTDAVCYVHKYEGYETATNCITSETDSQLLIGGVNLRLRSHLATETTSGLLQCALTRKRYYAVDQFKGLSNTNRKPYVGYHLITSDQIWWHPAAETTSGLHTESLNSWIVRRRPAICH